MNGKLNVAVVGLRFGGEFPCIYRDHPDVESVIVCDSDPTTLNSYANRFGFERRCSDFDQLLGMCDLDAIHIVTPLDSHAPLTLKVLSAGKHCACTVPMAMSIQDMRAIVNAQRASRKYYMMMETSVYTYQCLYVEQLIREGKFGCIQYLRGTHFQDLELWPDYWKGLPPLYYATHAVAPLLHLSQTYAIRVRCLGSGYMRDELVANYGNPYPIEHALVELSQPGLVAEITRSLFHTAIAYVEGFTVLGEKLSFEWDIEDEPGYLFQPVSANGSDIVGTRGRRRDMLISRAQYPDFSHLLPETIRNYAKPQAASDPFTPHQSVLQGGGHHGSHPHMVNEFLRAIMEDRPPLVDALTAARWSAVGVCAHQSALSHGATIDIPDFLT